MMTISLITMGTLQILLSLLLFGGWTELRVKNVLLVCLIVIVSSTLSSILEMSCVVAGVSTANLCKITIDELNINIHR